MLRAEGFVCQDSQSFPRKAGRKQLNNREIYEHHKPNLALGQIMDSAKTSQKHMTRLSAIQFLRALTLGNVERCAKRF